MKHTVILERPADLILTERIQLLSGWIAPATEGCKMKVRCGDHEFPVRRFLHPVMGRKATGFWCYLLLQEVLDTIQHGDLTIDLLRDDTSLQTFHLRVSPLAREMAERHPLNLEVYPVRASNQTYSRHPRTLVFPGLGGVGGASLNQLFRFKSYREDWIFPVYSEANDTRLWPQLTKSYRNRVRWVDGHNCYDSISRQNGTVARITLLRDPLRRTLSIFNYIKIVHPQDLASFTLEEFVTSGEAKNHSQAIGLLRTAGRDVSPSIGDAELYQLARSELSDHYDLIGITELFEETIFLICALAGFSDINMWWRVLAAPKHIESESLPTRVLKAMRELLAVDFALYEEHRSKLIQEALDADFGATLARYKTDADRQTELSDSLKMAECLRWRQIMTEEELANLKHARAITDLENRAQGSPVRNRRLAGAKTQNIWSRLWKTNL